MPAAFLGCTDPLTAEFVSSRTGLASVSVTSESKSLNTWRVSNYTPEFRESHGVGKRPVLTPDEVLRLPIDEALVIIRGKKALKVSKMDYSRHPEYPKLRECKASAHIPDWAAQERTAPAAATTIPNSAPMPPRTPAPMKPPRRRTPAPSAQQPKPPKPKKAPAPPIPAEQEQTETFEAPETVPSGIIITDKDSILS